MTLEQKAEQSPGTQFILAVEEPEAFLHPHRQKELYADIRAAQSDNLRVIVTTHSPYIVAETPFTQLGLVRKEGQHSALHVPSIASNAEGEMFDAYSNDVNASLFFADKVLLVEGESDVRVIRALLQKKLGKAAHRISVISAAGNRNFSPFLRMIKAWGTANIRHLVVTDLDSLTKSAERALIRGAKDAGYSLASEAAFIAKVDAVLDKGEEAFTAAAQNATTQYAAAGLNLFVFSSDLEYSLVTPATKTHVAEILNEAGKKGTNYGTGYAIDDLRRLIGSKGIPLKANEDAKFKLPYLHRKIASAIDLDDAHPDIGRLLGLVEAL